MPADINPRRQWSRNPGGFRRQKKAPPEQGQLKATLGDYVALPSWRSEALRFIVFLAKNHRKSDLPEYFSHEKRFYSQGTAKSVARAALQRRSKLRYFLRTVR